MPLLPLPWQLLAISAWSSANSLPRLSNPSSRTRTQSPHMTPPPMASSTSSSSTSKGSPGLPSLSRWLWRLTLFVCVQYLYRKSAWQYPCDLFCKASLVYSYFFRFSMKDTTRLISMGSGSCQPLTAGLLWVLYITSLVKEPSESKLVCTATHHEFFATCVYISLYPEGERKTQW